MNDSVSYEGRQHEIPELALPPIEVWAYQFPNGPGAPSVEISTPDFTCVCPKTGLPDFGTIRIIYRPRASCIELKSFKEYLLAFRNLGIFHEHIVQKILKDLVAVVDPVFMNVEVKMNPRGGVYVTANAQYNGSRRAKEAPAVS